MRIPRIYTEQPLANGAAVDLESGPSAHLARALRLQVGDPIRVFDGNGGEYQAQIQDLKKKNVQLLIGQHIPDEVESPLRIELAVAVSRGDRMDWVMQKATELGVHCIAPLTTERTEVKLKGERAQKKHRHWQQVIISACEQCGRNQLPELKTLSTLDSWLERSEAERKFVLHHRDEALAPASAAPESVAVLIGPEGGLSEEEIANAMAQNCEPLSLGPRVLRTETAPLAAVAIIQARWGDMPLERS